MGAVSSVTETQTSVVMPTLRRSWTVGSTGVPDFCATRNPAASRKEQIIALISLQALIRHQNHRSR